MEQKRSKIKEIIEYDNGKFFIVNIVLEKSRKGYQGKKEIYNIVFTAYNQKAKCVKEKFKEGDVVDINFRIKSHIQPNRIQTLLIVQKVELWKKVADKIQEKMEAKLKEKELDNAVEVGFKVDEETGEIL